MRRVVEREFDKPSPQLQGVKFVFFEAADRVPGAGNTFQAPGTGPGTERKGLKRVWMMCQHYGPHGGILLGYDGKQWIERQIKYGLLPEVSYETRSFFQMDDAVAFLDTTGCNVLHGNQWIYRSFFGGEPMSTTSRRAWLDPDGKGLLVCAWDGKHSKLWHYRDGTWKNITWPGEFSLGTKLGDACYRAAQAIPERLREAFLRTGRKPPEQTLTKIDMDGKVTQLDPQTTVKVGEYRFSPICETASDCDGTTYALCAGAPGTRKLGRGVLVCQASDKTYYVPSRTRRNWHTAATPSRRSGWRGASGRGRRSR